MSLPSPWRQGEGKLSNNPIWKVSLMTHQFCEYQRELIVGLHRQLSVITHQIKTLEDECVLDSVEQLAVNRVFLKAHEATVKVGELLID